MPYLFQLHFMDPTGGSDLRSRGRGSGGGGGRAARALVERTAGEYGRHRLSRRPEWILGRKDRR